MSDNEASAESYTRVESVETDVANIIVRWERKTQAPSGHTRYTVMIGTASGWAYFTPREFMEVSQKVRDMLRSLGGMEGGIPSG